MKKYGLILLFILLACKLTYAQADTSAYNLQRKKVNQLLEQRSSRFGQYDQSLKMKTGIFGLIKTKKDMQHSIDILTAIVQTDNNIFSELKILLDYKDYEKTQAQSDALQNESRISNYMTTITKLQQQNDKLTAQYSAVEKEKKSLLTAFIIIAVVAIVFMIVIIRKKITLK